MPQSEPLVLTTEEMATAMTMAHETGGWDRPVELLLSRALLQLAAQVAEQKVDLAQRLHIATAMQQRAEAAEAKVARLTVALQQAVDDWSGETIDERTWLANARAALAPPAPQPEVKL